jgi:hypothetical protein
VIQRETERGERGKEGAQKHRERDRGRNRETERDILRYERQKETERDTEC